MAVLIHHFFKYSFTFHFKTCIIVFLVFSNPNLSRLPSKLGLLKNIYHLNLSGLEIDNVPYKLDGKSSFPFNFVLVFINESTLL